MRLSAHFQTVFALIRANAHIVGGLSRPLDPRSKFSRRKIARY
jgi:hypothetical protein